MAWIRLAGRLEPDDITSGVRPLAADLSHRKATVPSSLSSDSHSPALDGKNDVAFADLGLHPDTLQTVTAMGYTVPTAIQVAAIPALLSGRDVVGIAQTGTGKTAAFGLPLVEMVDGDSRQVQALVLAPTRELALQTSQALTQFSADSGIEVLSVYGGSPYGPQLQALRKGAQVVVGTPGRVIDLIEKGALKLDDVRIFVLDEADEMLRMGFAEDVETISSSLPESRLTALFSATMPAPIARVAQNHLQDPVRLEVSTASTTVDTIHQTYAVVPLRYRFEALTRVLAVREGGASIVFVKTRQDAEDISLDLAGAGFRAAGMSGDVAQQDRERLVQRLRNGSLDVLVATDVAARGLDVERISLVVNYEAPREKEAYVHRVGRTGRAGRDGESLTFFGPKDQFRLRQIERLTGMRMEEVKIPSHSEVVKFVAGRQLSNLPNLENDPTVPVLETALDEALADGASLRQIALQLLAEKTSDLDTAAKSKGATGSETDAHGFFTSSQFGSKGARDKKARNTSDRPRRRGPSDASFDHRYRVEVGRRDGVNPGAIVGAITGEGGLTGDQVGHINIFPNFSLVEISEKLSPSQVNRIGRATVRGRKLRITTDGGSIPNKRAGRQHATGKATPTRKTGKKDRRY